MSIRKIITRLQQTVEMMKDYEIREITLEAEIEYLKEIDKIQNNKINTLLEENERLKKSNEGLKECIKELLSPKKK